MRRLIVGLTVMALLAASAYGDVFNMGPGLTSLKMVPVGHPSNANDDTGYGSVADPYLIGKYEVTAGQYTEFLNAVAADHDTYRLYTDMMRTETYGCRIHRAVWMGDYRYYVAEDRANRPVNFVSWGSAARFANWLHNGQPTGAQDSDTTEDGAYELNGAMTLPALMAVVRKPGATWFLPTENQWYKAAYYDGTGSVYYDYSTGSDGPPSNDLIAPDPGNNANFYHYGPTIGGLYYMTEVGDFENSASPYGTFDQGGNLSEWSESVHTAGSLRVSRDGPFFGDSFGLRAAYRAGSSATSRGYGKGFRVASVPEPGSITLLVCGAIGLLAYGWRRRRRTA